jgi:hypothetical protein
MKVWPPFRVGRHADRDAEEGLDDLPRLQRRALRLLLESVSAAMRCSLSQVRRRRNTASISASLEPKW